MAPTPNKHTPNRGRKSISSWETCNNCEAVLLQKHTEIHKADCKSNYDDWQWKHNFIKNNILHGIIEVIGMYPNKSI